MSDAFDVMYLFAGETAESSLKNLAKNAYHATAVNSPTFSQFEGFTRSSSTSYINTNFNLATNALKYELNSCSYGHYIRTNSALDASDGGIVSGGNRTFTQIRRATNNAIIIDTNQGSNGNTKNNLVSDSTGFFITSRRSNILTDVYKNKSIITTDNISSSVLPNGYVFILGINLNGTIGLSSTRQQSFFFMSKVLSSSDITALTNAIESYMDSNGKGVIA